MITTEVKPYCEDCPDFEACTEKVGYSTDNMHVLCETKIKCRYADRCARMYERMLEDYISKSHAINIIKTCIKGDSGFDNGSDKAIRLIEEAIG